MRANSSPEVANQTTALHTITSVPLDPHLPLLEHYPAMKLGVRESVRYYARLLVPLVQDIMASQPRTVDWVMTAPPLYVMPSAANLLSWQISRFFDEMSAGSGPRVVDLRYSLPNPGSLDFTRAGDYSSSGIEERIVNRRMLFEGEWAPKPNPFDFQGRAVIVVNDINVTGTQQQFIQRALEAVGPASIHWVYVVQVDPVLGRLHPEVEHSLNHLKLASFEEFAAIVARSDIDYTARCITRLFRYPDALLIPLFRSMDETRRKTLRQLILDEGAHTAENRKARVELIV